MSLSTTARLSSCFLSEVRPYRAIGRTYMGITIKARPTEIACTVSTAGPPPIPRRSLGKTGCEVTQFALGGEGVLRTHGRLAEAIAVIDRALDQGVTYC